MLRHLDVAVWALLGLLLALTVSSLLPPSNAKDDGAQKKLQRRKLVAALVTGLALAVGLGAVRFFLGRSSRRAALRAAAEPPLDLSPTTPRTLVPEPLVPDL